MATIWYAQEGSVNINHVGLWDDVAAGGGNVLTWANLAADDVLCANAQADININVNVTCARISTAAEGTGAAGGGFLVAGAVTIAADVLAGNGSCIVVTGESYTLTVVGDVTGGDGASGKCIDGSGATSVNMLVTGNVCGGSGTDASGLVLAGSGDLTTVGDILGGEGDCGVLFYSTGAFSHTGSVTGGAGYSGVSTDGLGTVTIVGNVTGGSVVGVPGLINSGAEPVTVSHGNLINTATGSAVAGAVVCDPVAGNYIEYPGPIRFGFVDIDEAALAAAVWAYGNRTLT